MGHWFSSVTEDKSWRNIVVASLPDARKSDFANVAIDSYSTVECGFAMAIQIKLKEHSVESTVERVTSVDMQPPDDGYTRIWHTGLSDSDLAQPEQIRQSAEKFHAVILLHSTTGQEAFLSRLKGCKSKVFHVTSQKDKLQDFRQYIARATGESKVYAVHKLGTWFQNDIRDFSSLVCKLAGGIKVQSKCYRGSCVPSLRSLDTQSVGSSSVDGQSFGHHSINPRSMDPPSDDPPSVDPPSVDPPSIDPLSVDPPINPATLEFFSSMREALQPGSVNIAVVGLSGVGKSVFAEALKVVIKACNDIELTIVEVTDEPLQFSPCSEQVNIWDLPGIDEKKAHWRMYVKAASQCDAVIFLHGTRIMEVDQKVLKDLNGSEGPEARPQIFHVRSRIDSEVKAARRRPPAGVTKEAAEGNALEEIREYIKTATGVPRAYMVCALEPDDENENDVYNWWNWDFKALARDLAEEIKAVESRKVEESGGGREVS